MSEATKKAGQKTIEYLQQAERYLQGAKQTAENTGDKGLIQKIVKIHTDTQQVRQETEKKMEPKND